MSVVSVVRVFGIVASFALASCAATAPSPGLVAAPAAADTARLASAVDASTSQREDIRAQTAIMLEVLKAQQTQNVLLAQILVASHPR